MDDWDTMPVRILTGGDVTRLLPMAACIEAMAGALAALARGEALLPLRTVLRLPRGRGAFGAMPAQLDQPDTFGIKVISVHPGNEGTRFDSHQGAVLLYEPVHGTLAAILDAAALTAIRTAAVSAVATRALAPDEPADLAILGTGVQARTHLDAMRTVRPVERIRVWSRHDAHRTAFARWAGSAMGLRVEACDSARAAVHGAGIICTVTSSRQPVLESPWVRDGAHINAVGASQADARELASALVARARVFVDRRESAEHEAGDLLIPRAEGAIGPDHVVGELGDLVLGRIPGRRSPEEVTLFKSLGLAVEDLAAAHLVLTEAARIGAGLVVELGGVRA
jgi:ornithine cyclodeaminase/alanine dehydrogenase-like protein (mu-crystallin family)